MKIKLYLFIIIIDYSKNKNKVIIQNVKNNVKKNEIYNITMVCSYVLRGKSLQKLEYKTYCCQI